jgi:iron-sulfur cluster assembly accessory protein
LVAGCGFKRDPRRSRFGSGGYRMAQELAHEHNGGAAMSAEETQIKLTPRALEMVRKMHIKEGLGPEQGLRVTVVGGGCSGFQYQLGFDVEKEGDSVTVLDGMRVFVDEVSLPYVGGTTLDYVEGLHNAGFRFDNPRASRTCGCGSSFSA